MIAPRSLYSFCMGSLCLGALALVVPAFAAEGDKESGGTADGGWVSLFDGKTLKGWEQKNGTAKYEVKNGAILGSTAEGSPNSFLCTTKDYGDFELVFEVQLLRDDLNSGVQLRSHSRPEFKNGRVNGPQVEIESSPGQAGYIYGEASTGAWISPDADEKPTDAFKNGQWNTYRVLAVGPRIQTWVNGEPITDVSNAEANNAKDPGFIGLQVHQYQGPHPAQVMWRNIRIREVKGEAGGK
jgi:hypothetical protein